MSFVLSPRARADLVEIWDHSERRWGIDQAERYVRQIQSTLEMISKNRRLGSSMDGVRPGYRKQRCGRHVIFYRLTDTGIDVVRILHERMDFERHL